MCPKYIKHCESFLIFLFSSSFFGLIGCRKGIAKHFSIVLFSSNLLMNAIGVEKMFLVLYLHPPNYFMYSLVELKIYQYELYEFACVWIVCFCHYEFDAMNFYSSCFRSFSSFCTKKRNSVYVLFDSFNSVFTQTS